MKLIPEEFLSIKDKLKSKLKETETGCHEWTGALAPSGYGYITASRKWRLKNRYFRTHRVFYFLEIGIQPGELLVLHACDNPPCCNPKHLFLGTNADNSLDCVLKGRKYRPAAFEYSTVVTKEVFEDLKIEYQSTGMSINKIAKKYNINPATISIAFKKNGVDASRKRQKLMEKDVIEIRRLKSLGESTNKDIARMFNITTDTVVRVYTGKSWGHIKTPHDSPKDKGK